MDDSRPRPLGPDWRQAVVDLERRSQPHPWTPAQLEEAFEAPRTTVWGRVGAAGRLEGFAVLERQPFEAELQAITVAPEARRQGVARGLLEALLEEARGWGSERLLLEVRAGNAAAIALYRGLGFMEEGRRRGYYPAATPGAPREDALLMSRPPWRGRP